MPRHEERGWWERNWGWVVGIGCGCLLLPVLVVGACVGGVGWLTMRTLDGGAVLTEPSTRAAANPEVIARLGEPVKVGLAFHGAINVNDDEGRADFWRPISGPRGSGRLEVEAVRESGEWRFTRIEVRIDGDDEPIDLLGEDAPGAPPDTI